MTSPSDDTTRVAVEIRQYEERDERGWLLCRLLSFFDSAFFDAVVGRTTCP